MIGAWMAKIIQEPHARPLIAFDESMADCGNAFLRNYVRQSLLQLEVACMRMLWILEASRCNECLRYPSGESLA